MTTPSEKDSKRLEAGNGFIAYDWKVRDDLSCREIDVMNKLRKFKDECHITVREMALFLDMDESYLSRMMHGRSRFGQMIGLAVIDPIFTKLGIELPPIYAKAWVRIEED
jgi:hypothetical protein